MQNKRGISSVITTILFILIGIVSVITIWVVIDNNILDKTSKISLSSLTIDLEIESAIIDGETKTAIIKVARNAGEGDLKSIKFIIEDNENAQVYEELLQENELQELGKKTFYINLGNSFLNIFEIQKISIAPVYYTGGSGDLGSSTTSSVIDSVEGDLYQGTELGDGGENGDEGTGGQYCDEENPCPESGWDENSLSYCDLGDVKQKWEEVTCSLNNYCIYSYEFKILDDCIGGEVCYEDSSEGATCLAQQISCTLEPKDPVCGEDRTNGNPKCSDSPERIVQDYINYSCVAGYCEYDITQETIETCPEEWVCFDTGQGPECYEPDECLTHQECWDLYGPGYVCKEQESKLQCVVEEPIVSGIVKSVWPHNIGEYIDSYNLPEEQGTVKPFHYIIFTSSSDSTPETRCLQILNFEYFEDSIPYVRLNETKTNVTENDNFEIWETVYSCSLI